MVMFSTNTMSVSEVGGAVKRCAQQRCHEVATSPVKALEFMLLPAKGADGHDAVENLGHEVHTVHTVF